MKVEKRKHQKMPQKKLIFLYDLYDAENDEQKKEELWPQIDKQIHLINEIYEKLSELQQQYGQEKDPKKRFILNQQLDEQLRIHRKIMKDMIGFKRGSKLNKFRRDLKKKFSRYFS
jgi:hypothetical protein